MRRQQGMALITVLLVVAVVTVISAGIINRQQVSIRSSANQLHVRQALQYAMGGEILAKAILQRDFNQGNTSKPVDHLGERWAKFNKPFALDEGGQLQIQIIDLTSRFNLNSLVRNERIDKPAVAQFRRLLLSLQLNAAYTERLIDWIDADDQPSGGYGAEDNQYLLDPPAYRAANREFTDVSELRLILDMTQKDYQLLQPYVTALPADATLNINTASARILTTLADGISYSTAQGLVAARGAQGYSDPAAIEAQLGGMKLESQARDVGSRYFQVITDVTVGDRRQVLRSNLYRGADGKVFVLSRDLGQGALMPVVVEEEQE